MNVTSTAIVSYKIPVHRWFYSLEYESDLVLWSGKDVEERGTAIAVEWLGRLRKTFWYSASGQRIESVTSRIRNRSTSHSPLLSLCFTFKFVSPQRLAFSCRFTTRLTCFDLSSCNYLFSVAYEKRGAVVFPPPPHHVAIARRFTILPRWWLCKRNRLEFFLALRYTFIAFSNSDKMQENTTAKNIRIECSKIMLTSVEGSNCGWNLLCRKYSCVCVSTVLVYCTKNWPQNLTTINTVNHTRWPWELSSSHWPT